MAELLGRKVCIVTGAGKGIGKAIAQAYIENGATVYALEHTEGDVSRWSEGLVFNGTLVPIAADIRSVEALKKLILRVRKEHERLDVVVNNAGVEFNERIGMITEEHMDFMYQVNVKAVINLIQLAARVMMRQEWGGSIINISSGVGLHGNSGQLAYSATKGAVIALTKTAAKELGPYKIRVNSIAPGLTNTKMMREADASRLRERIGRISMGRIAEPEDIAGAAVFLASEMSSYVSGQVLSVDGCAIM